MYIDEDNRYYDEHNCSNCKYGYFAGFSPGGFYNLCGADLCYLYVGNNAICFEYEFGDMPEGYERVY